MTTTPDLFGLIPRRRYIILSAGGVSLASPGIAIITRPNSPRLWDERQGYGFSGASLVFTGAGLSAFDVQLLLVEPPDHLAWQPFSLLLTNPPAPPGVIPVSLGIDHPQLNAKPWLITKVVVLDVLGHEYNETGLCNIVIKFKQYRKAKPALLAPLEGPPGASVVPVPQTAQQKINAQLDADNAALRAQAATP